MSVAKISTQSGIRFLGQLVFPTSKVCIGRDNNSWDFKEKYAVSDKLFDFSTPDSVTGYSLSWPADEKVYNCKVKPTYYKILLVTVTHSSMNAGGEKKSSFKRKNKLVPLQAWIFLWQNLLTSSK